MIRLRPLFAAIATTLALLIASVSPAHAEPTSGSSISGTVTSPAGGPPTQWVMVNARQGSYNANWIAYADETTGAYTIDGLPPGSYLVYFSPVVTNIFEPQYREQLYDGVYSVSEATRIDITADGQTFTGIDAAMEYDLSTVGNPVDALPCVDPRRADARQTLVKTFLTLGGSAEDLTRSNLNRYYTRCAPVNLGQ